MRQLVARGPWHRRPGHRRSWGRCCRVRCALLTPAAGGRARGSSSRAASCCPSRARSALRPSFTFYLLDFIHCLVSSNAYRRSRPGCLAREGASLRYRQWRVRSRRARPLLTDAPPTSVNNKPPRRPRRECPTSFGSLLFFGYFQSLDLASRHCAAMVSAPEPFFFVEKSSMITHQVQPRRGRAAAAALRFRTMARARRALGRRVRGSR